MKQGKVSLTGLFLSSFLGAIIFIILFAIFDITAQPSYELKLTFVIINVLAIVFNSTFSKLLINSITIPMYIAVTSATSIYSILQFVSLGLSFSDSNINFYLIFQLIILFIYFLVTIPLIKTGNNIVQKNK
ncbi:MAG: hypothetical protein UD936_04545 [Acutalibacteraceae bacterium]|nr:hypothetical protein [Acutalibacteraceae bacterium]